MNSRTKIFMGLRSVGVAVLIVSILAVVSKTATAIDINKGMALYSENCAACHGAKLEGQPNWREQLPSGRLPAPPHDASTRGDDFYETPPEAVWALMGVEKFSPTIWEPACGKGAISNVMIEAGYKFQLSDLRDRGAVNQDGELANVENFLNSKWRRNTKNQPAMDMVTNPPFKDANAFIAHAMREHRPRKIAMLLNMNAMCGTENADRNFWMDEHPPARIYIFSRRLPMMHRDGYEGPRSGSQMNTAWFIWELGKNGKYPSKPSEMHRLDWKEFVPETAEAGGDE